MPRKERDAFDMPVVALLLLLAVTCAIAQDVDTLKAQQMPQSDGQSGEEDPYVAVQILVPKALESINRRQDYVQALWKQVQELQQYEPPPTFNQGRFLEWILKLMQNN